MKNAYKYLLVLALTVCALTCCDMNERVYDRIDATVYYQNEASVKGAVAAIYGNAAMSYPEYFWYLNEFSADQIVWRVWNGGLWGYDEGEKTVLSTHTWTADSKIIRLTWETAWGTIGLCNSLISDLGKLEAKELGMTDEKLQSYISEVRTLRAWAYYNCFELWGGAIPLYTEDDGTIPPSADTDFQKGCIKVYDFICAELDDTYADLPKEDGSNATRNRMNQAVNRMIKMRMLLNSQVFTGTPRFS
ncbi:MAG: RagB/SusD family nutrient uptake outer membrane protein, partial [Paludibacteraceae bacterium]|nr:RagB/SusD family nutrient uptake outer membrane protein [Paludibacteraceae bacterium]